MEVGHRHGYKHLHQSLLSKPWIISTSNTHPISFTEVAVKWRTVEEDVLKTALLSFSYSEVGKAHRKVFLLFYSNHNSLSGFSWQTKSENIIDVIKEWKGQNKIPLLQKKNPFFLSQSTPWPPHKINTIRLINNSAVLFKRRQAKWGFSVFRNTQEAQVGAEKLGCGVKRNFN